MPSISTRTSTSSCGYETTRAIHRADANPPIGGGVAVKFESRVFLPSPEGKNRSTPPSLVEERKGGKHSRDQVNFHFIRRERSIIRFSLSLPFLSRYHISRGRERERGGELFSRSKEGGKNAGGSGAWRNLYLHVSVAA